MGLSCIEITSSTDASYLATYLQLGIDSFQTSKDSAYMPSMRKLQNAHTHELRVNEGNELAGRMDAMSIDSHCWFLRMFLAFPQPREREMIDSPCTASTRIATCGIIDPLT